MLTERKRRGAQGGGGRSLNCVGDLKKVPAASLSVSACWEGGQEDRVGWSWEQGCMHSCIASLCSLTPRFEMNHFCTAKLTFFPTLCLRAIHQNNAFKNNAFRKPVSVVK